MDTQELIERQCEFYKLRSSQWQMWIEGYMGQLTDPLEELIAATPELQRDPDVLEIASGTGYFTRLIAPLASHIWALDSASEMLAQLDGLGLRNVTTMCHDVFDWSPSRRYDAIVCANWLSHVPHELWRSHWRMLEDALAPGGVVVAVDATVDELPHLGGHAWWKARMDDGHREPLTTRALDDGSQHVVVKQFWDPDTLLEQVSEFGWQGEHALVSQDRGVIFYRLRRAAQ